MAVTFENIREHCRCCACDGSLVESPHVNLVEMAFAARWKYPVAGNVLTGDCSQAVAVVCDACLGEQRTIERVIEFRDDEVVYHLVADLREAASS